MAEVMEHAEKHPSNAKVNAALTTGIIGTSLAGLLTLGKGGLSEFFGGSKKNCDISENWDLYNERKEQQDYVELTKQFYNGQIANERAMNQKFFDLYKMNVDNSFALYKGQRDTKDDLIEKINCLSNRIDVMQAVRPYQDALINAKIDNVALVGDFNLARRTCKMITGELVLPSTPTVTGYPSYNPCNPTAAA